ARMDGGRLTVDRARVPARALVLEVAESQQAAAAAGSLELRLELQDELPDVWGDRHRLLQVLENLVANATKFTGAHGTITLGAASQNGDVRFSIQDTGSGIAPEDLPHVFERFWQAQDVQRRRGAGLGLPIVKGIVEAHGGRIWVESIRGQGTTM